MLGRRIEHPENDSSDGRDDEARIRADERARMEQELNSLQADRAGSGDGRASTDMDGDTRTERAGFVRSTDADRRTGPDDDRIGADDRLTRDDTRDRVGDDDRLTRDDTRDRVGDDDRLTRDETRDRIGDDDRVVMRRDEEIEVVRTRSFSFGQLLTLIAGAALIALGIVAMVQTDLDSPLNEPVEAVLGWNHTALLGIFEIVAGALLVLFSLRPGGRWIVALVGLALVVGGVLILGELDWTVDELGAEQEFGWVPIVAGVIAIVASLFTPRRHQRMTGVPVTR